MTRNSVEIQDKYPLVTVFTLIYNTNAKYIIEAIESVRENNYPNIQHIIIDDCSTNREPKKIVQNWIKKENYQCEFYEHTENYGICRTLNHVIELSKGEFLLGCCDDILLKNRISGDVDIFLNKYPKVDIVYSQCLNKYEDVKKSSKEINPNARVEGDILHNLLWSNFINAAGVSMRVSALREMGGFDLNFKIDDYPMWLKLASYGYGFHYREELTSIYRIHSTGFSSSKKMLVDFEDFRAKLRYTRRFDNNFYLFHRDLVENAIVSNNEYAKFYINEFVKKYGNHYSLVILKKFAIKRLDYSLINLIQKLERKLSKKRFIS
jgi:glycosyltransferase involved in cell wall biosynthesis